MGKGEHNLLSNNMIYTNDTQQDPHAPSHNALGDLKLFTGEELQFKELPFTSSNMDIFLETGGFI